MNSIGKALHDLRARSVILPDHSQCPECHFWDVDDPETASILREAGRTLSEAACRCPQRREQEAREDAERWVLANLPHQHPDDITRTFTRFKARQGAEDALKAAKDIVARQGPHILFLLGDAGTGKTHLVESIGREWLHRGGTVRYDFAPELLDELRGTYDNNNDSISEMVKWRNTRGLLILDDVGQGKASEWVQEKITALVDHRYRNGGYMVVTSNLTYDQMQVWGGFRLASRLWDRSEIVNTVHLTCTDYRQHGGTVS
jgi:DNA replication protein DnaC